MTTDTPRFVLDSYALLALVQDEAGASAVQALLRRAFEQQVQLAMSVINYGEVFYRSIRDRGLDQAALLMSDLESHPITFFDIDLELIRVSAELKAVHPIAFADCIAAALAQRLGATVATGDADFRRLEHLVRVEWLSAS
ncbi:MAG: type II toxin-antitoxin system VapC family toxin [Chloroflexi bacterium]|nr:type II toxin-antitoxin system VapC family toxin [Chloroflexota bacterium]